MKTLLSCLWLIAAKAVCACSNNPVAVSPPGPPSRPAASSGRLMVSLSWPQVDGASYYKVFSRTGAGVGPTDPSLKVYGTTASLTGLTGGQAYSFMVVAGNDTGESAASPEAGAIPKPAWGTDLADLSMVARLDSSKGIRNWTAVASSADGGKYAAGDATGAIYLSFDKGAFWTGNLAMFATPLSALAARADGNYFYGASGEGTCTMEKLPSSVSTFTKSLGNVSDLAVNADGGFLAVVGSTGIFMNSNDGGVNWSAGLPVGTTGPYALACSASGTVVYLSEGPAKTIKRSLDRGVGFTGLTLSLPGGVADLACSADGSRVIAAGSGASVWTSADFGASWTERTAPGTRAWAAVTCGADGKAMAALAADGTLAVSVNSGLAWRSFPQGAGNNFTDLAAAADGLHLIACASPGDIWFFEPVWTP